MTKEKKTLTMGGWRSRPSREAATRNTPVPAKEVEDGALRMVSFLSISGVVGDDPTLPDTGKAGIALGSSHRRRPPKTPTEASSMSALLARD